MRTWAIRDEEQCFILFLIYYLKRFLSRVYHPVGLEMFQAHESLGADVTLTEKIIFKL